MVTWKQLRLHSKPIVVLNIEGCWDKLGGLVDDIINAGFAHEKISDLFTMVETAEDVFTAIENAPDPEPIVLTDHL